MARTREEIYNLIIAKKNEFEVLAELNSSSETAIYKLWARTSADIMALQEEFFEQYQKDIQDKIDRNIYGIPEWFVSILKKFQEGDNLEVINGALGYSIIDTAKQIIKHASFVEQQQGGFILLKVATEIGGVLAPLSSEQLIQVTAYLNDRRPAGVKYSLISTTADKLEVSADIYYNALFTQSVIKANVEAAIKNYLNNLSFDGIVYASRLQDAIQAVEGVEDVYLNQLIGKSTIGETIFNRNYRSRAGYLIPDDSAGNTLNDTLTYIAA